MAVFDNLMLILTLHLAPPRKIRGGGGSYELLPELPASLFLLLVFPCLAAVLFKKGDEVDVAVDERQVVPALVKEEGAGGEEEQPAQKGDCGGYPAGFGPAEGDIEGYREA